MVNFKSLLSLYDKFYLIDSDTSMVLLNNKWGLIDKEGKIIIPIKYQTLTSPNQNIFIAFNGITYGAFNEKGKIIIPFRYKTYHRLFNTYCNKIK